MANRVVLRALSALLLMVPLAWFGGRHTLMSHDWITGPRGWFCWGLAWLAFIGGAWIWALSSEPKADEGQEWGDRGEE